MSSSHGHHHGHAHPPAVPMPPAVRNIYLFDFFNAMNWSVVLGGPMLLYFQHLHASATMIAIACCLSPLLNILQLPAAHFVEKVGYKRFVLAGWTSRSFLIVGMMGMAFLPESVSPMFRIVGMLILSFLFNVLRGISACGVLPWFTHIVPEQRRGEFLARDQAASAFANIVSPCICGLLLTGDHSWYSFGLVYAIAVVAAFTSLVFLRRVPDVPVEKEHVNRRPPPWKEIFLYPPFLRYLRYNMIVNLALGTSGAFWIRFFRTQLHVSNSDTLYLICGTNLVVIIALYLITTIIDRTHNKQVLTFSGICYILHFSGWGLVAAGILPFSWTMIVIQAITAGFGGALWNLANVRMVIGIVPVMGRPHFLALYAVISNLTVGLIPLAWGPVLDYLEHWHADWGSWNWNCYSLLYSVLAGTMIVAICVLQTLKEPKKMKWDTFMRELLVKTPGAALSRVIGRLRGPIN